MANDGSVASKVESWIVGRIGAVSQFAAGTVETFLGSNRPDGDQLIDEMTAKRSPYSVVLFEGDQAVVTQEGQQDYLPTYGVYVTVQNERYGAARCGDGLTPGTNLLRDLLRNALHDQPANQAANGFFAERAEFRGCRIVFQRSDAFVMRAEIVVREVPSAPTTSTIDIYPTKDVFIASPSSDDSDDSNFNESGLRLGVGAALVGGQRNVRRLLMHFDLAAYGVPLGAVVNDAQLLGVVQDSYQQAANGWVERQTQTGWIEDQVTWNSYATGLPFSAPGGDVSATPAPVAFALPITIDQVNRQVIATIPTMAQDANDLRAQQLHLRLRLQDEITLNRYSQFFDRESGTLSLEPILRLTFTA